ncbi:rho guanine nucleotide exchange factor 7 isoform X2 [Osmia bicornis bicornis]|uniref:rho guanine nucleotide exchange factor 7 isoform X2 n=1 Tax=Osmia bicornis bicornis TaxID=1437191 RepID=UPI0010F4668F|nr:rho guanine nucleotide exchange factor 7 isoform X2 [Osmia bicornis bicornis]
MSKSDSPKYVTALFSFKGKNNDELCFKKGDVITITQTDEEGWWEGTLHDKTGWFPSNYVKECRVPDSGVSAVKASPEKIQQESPTHQKLNRDIVLKDIVDSERVNVAELQGLINSFLHPLESANILSKEEYKQLLGNIQEIMEVHQRLLNNLETTMAQGCASRVGNLFLTLAPKLKSIHTAYCGNHPRAVCVLDRYRDELNDFMERNGAISPGILVLTTGLSKPFRRLDKYSAMLQELERYTEKNHPDRGDTQRSIVVYREIADRCASIRKQRELALQVLTSGIKGWEGEELSSLGEILYVGSVTIANGTNGLDRRDRYFVLFPTTLLVLSTSPRMSSFVYEGKLPLTGINIIRKEDSEEIRNAFEITGPMIESILVLCTSKEERQRWIELLIQEQTASNSLVKSPTTSRICSQPNGKLQQQPQPQQQQQQQPRSTVEHCTPVGIRTPWSIASLRPAPPLYTVRAFGKTDTSLDLSRAPRPCKEKQFEEDAIILKVIEAYCLSVNARFTVHSGESTSMLEYDSHKSRDRTSLMHNRGNLDLCSNRVLSETVKTLKSQMTDLQSQMSLLTKQLDEERRSRLSLAATVKRSMGVVDGSVP